MGIFNWLFSNKKAIINGEVEAQEKQIHKIKREVFNQTAKTTSRLNRVNELLEESITRDLAKVTGAKL